MGSTFFFKQKPQSEFVEATKENDTNNNNSAPYIMHVPVECFQNLISYFIENGSFSRIHN